MTEELFDEISTYVEESIYHSSVWDEADETQRQKAVRNCLQVLLNELPTYYKVEADIPVDVIANQTVWFMRIDDTFLRAEMGITYIQMSGVMLTIKDKDRSIAPYVLSKLGITPDPMTGGLPRRKVARYTTDRPNGTSESLLRREP